MSVEAESVPERDTDEEAGSRVERVGPLELFFDLVFVFAITQITSVIYDHLGFRALWHGAVILGLVFWMYDGYAWLTNALLSQTSRIAKFLLCGMACFLVLAIAIPDSFTGTGLTFGIAYLLINLIHSYLFLTEAGDDAFRAMIRISPPNIAAAAIVLITGAIGGTAQEIGWSCVVPMEWFLNTRIGHGITVASTGAIGIGESHFVERHGQLVMIAIGESVAATGLAARSDLLHHPLNLSLILVVILGLAVSTVLWWIYFLDGDETVEEAFRGLSVSDHFRAGLYGFGYGHLLMLFGIVITAVGIRFAVIHPGATLTLGPAFALSGGVALFLGGDGVFRQTLALMPWGPRELGSLLPLASVPVTAAVNTDAGLALTAVLAVAVIARERAAAADQESE